MDSLSNSDIGGIINGENGYVALERAKEKWFCIVHDFANSHDDHWYLGGLATYDADYLSKHDG